MLIKSFLIVFLVDGYFLVEGFLGFVKICVINVFVNGIDGDFYCV